MYSDSCSRYRDSSIDGKVLEGEQRGNNKGLLGSEEGGGGGGGQELGSGKITEDGRWRITENGMARWGRTKYILWCGSTVFSRGKIQHRGSGYLEDHGLVKVEARLQLVRSVLTVFEQVICATWEFTVHTPLCR